MNIKTPFKCYWKRDTDTIYTVTDNTETHYLCSWIDEYGDKDSTDYSKATLFNLVNTGDVAILDREQQEPMVTLPESEYHSLIEEVNMLQELIAELSAPQPADTAQEQQAYTYQQMQRVLVRHPSFKELSDGSHCEELVGTIRLLQDAYDELNTDKEFKLAEFKPVREYTLADWELAMNEGWEFECRHGGKVTIQHVNEYSRRPVFCSNQYYHSVNGMWDEEDGEDIDDIVKLIK